MSATPSLGGADISGSDTFNPSPRPSPSRSSAPSKPPPQPKPPAAKGETNQGGRPETGQPHRQNAPHQPTQGPLQQFEVGNANPFLPMPAQALASVVDDSWKNWQLAKHVYDGFFGALLDPKAMKQSVNNVWEQRSAQASLMRYVITGDPLEALDPSKQQQQSAANVLPTGLGITANPANMLGGEGAAGLALGVGAPMLAGAVLGPGGPEGAVAGAGEDLKSLAHPELSTDYVAKAIWALTTGALLVGGTRLGVRSPAMAELLARAPWVSKYTQKLDEDIAAHNRRQADAQKPDAPVIHDWLSPLQADPPVAKPLAKGATEGHGTIFRGDPSGRTLVDITREKRQAQQATWAKRFGFRSAQDLEDQIYGGKRYSGEVAQEIIKNWGQDKLGFRYDLKFDAGEERPHVNPESHASQIPKEQLPEYTAFLNLARAAISHMNMNPVRGAAWHSSIRSLLGFNRGDEAISEAAQAAAHDLLFDPKTNTVPNEVAIRRATEGDQAAYDTLSPTEKAVSDTFRSIIGHLGARRQSTGYGSALDKGFFFRVPEVKQRAPAGTRRGRSPLAAESQKHRPLAIVPGPEGQLVATPAHRYVEDANAALTKQREYLIQSLTLNPAKVVEGGVAALPEEFRADPAHALGLVSRLSKATTAGERSVALKHLTEYVHSVVPLYDTGLFGPLQRSLGHQAQSIHSHVAAKDMLDTQMRAKNTASGEWETHQAAYDPRSAATQRQIEHLRNNLHYRQVSAPGYGDWLWHPDVANLLDHASGMSGLAASEGAIGTVYRKLMAANRTMISQIMLFPTVHGMNMGSRVGAFGMSNFDHPMHIASSFLGKDAAKTTVGTINPALTIPSILKDNGRWWFRDDLEMWQRRMEAYRAGVAPPSGAYRFGSEWAGSLSNTLNDTRILPDFSRMMDRLPKPADSLVKAGKTIGRAHDRWQSLFWSQVSDTGVSMYEVLKARAMANGVSEAEAGLWAGGRANDWIGHVMPEDWNPIVHEITRSLGFAPNWWYSKIRLLARSYKDAGFEMTPGMAHNLASDEIRGLLGQFFWQKTTGEFLNMLGSGHSQEQNQPSARQQIELTLPWTDYLPQTWGTPRANAKTGARRTWENPLARQDRDLEIAAGVAGDPTKPGLAQGSLAGPAWFLGNRLNPLSDSLAAAANIDLRRSIQQGFWNGPTHIDPTTSGLSGEALLAATLFSIPGGSDLLYAYQTQARQPSETDKPFPVQMTDGVKAAMSGLPKAAGSTLLAWAAGVNPAFDYAQKTAGKPVSDDQYQHIDAEMKSYQKEMAQQSTMALTGQLSPAEWQKWYHDRSLKHQATLTALYGNSPDYANGTMGMVSSYEHLYDQATNPETGQIDYAKLDQLQAAFRSDPSHSPSDLAAMDAELSKGDTLYPMLKLYHKSIAAYSNWTTTWARTRGLDPGQIRRDQSEYGAIVDANQKARYLAAHRELSTFYRDRATQFETTPQGLMYGLFFDSQTVMRYMTAHHITVDQAEQEAAS